MARAAGKGFLSIRAIKKHMRQCWSYLLVFWWKLLDTLQHGATGAPQRLLARGDERDEHDEHDDDARIRAPRPIPMLPALALLHDAWRQAPDFLCSPASRITDHVWLGNAMNAADASFMAGIDAVVNVTQEVPNLYPARCTYCQIAVRDVQRCTLPYLSLIHI